ncbi:MAG: T9SS type A sorting domain-containing protein [Cytophagaceae bacterium]
MKKIYSYSLTLIFSCLFAQSIWAQCPTDLVIGQNIVCNGDFEDGDECFITDYTPFPPGDGRTWSIPDDYYVGSNSAFFNNAFAGIGDHSTGTGNFLMVDGSCDDSRSVWCQTVDIIPNTNYYFSTFITSLHPDYPARLQFSVNGGMIGSPFDAPATVGAWDFFEEVWFSGAATTATICVENLTTAGCADGNDFGLDDISFIPGCAFADLGPAPHLGEDVTICGAGSITINTGLTPSAGMDISWSTGESGTGMGAPYSIQVTSPGVYSICVSENGSCISSDIIAVFDEYEINLGPDVELCDPAVATLDAGFEGVGVTYQWYRDGVPIPDADSRTYMVTSPGAYSVISDDPICGVQTDVIDISTKAAIPNGADFCGANSEVPLSVSGPGEFEWYSDASGGSLLGAGPGFTTPPISTTTTFYVEDVSSFTAIAGPTSQPCAGTISGGERGAIMFTAYTDFTLVSIDIVHDNHGGGGTDNFTVDLLSNNPTAMWCGSCCGGGCNVDGPGTVLSTHSGGSFPRPGSPTVRTLEVNIPITGSPAGTVYWLRLGNGPAVRYFNCAAPAPGFPYNDNLGGDVFQINKSVYDNNPTTNYGIMYNFVASAGNNCARVPVTATYDCTTPVELVAFNLSNEHKGVLLSWSTASEVNASHFVVERSYDGVNFVPIASVDASGNSNNRIDYQFLDENASNGDVYYRLVQVDSDGTVNVGPVRHIQLKGDYEILIHPNPNSGIFSLNIKAPASSDISVDLLSIHGTKLLHYQTTSNGLFNKDIDIRHLPQGVYIADVKINGERNVRKIIKD